MNQASFEINRWHWTHQHFDQMGWHDVNVHALAYDPVRWEFMMDLDYIFKWVEPTGTDTHYSFWISPATMIFADVRELRIDVEPFSGFQLDAVDRLTSGGGPDGSPVESPQEWLWSISVFNGEISLKSTGYDLWVRAAPSLVSDQMLELEARGGRSFGREPPTGSV